MFVFQNFKQTAFNFCLNFSGGARISRRFTVYLYGVANYYSIIKRGISIAVSIFRKSNKECITFFISDNENTTTSVGYFRNNTFNIIVAVKRNDDHVVCREEGNFAICRRKNSLRATFKVASDVKVGINVVNNCRFVSRIAVTACTGIGRETSYRTGRSGYNCFIVMYVCFIVRVFCTACALALNVGVTSSCNFVCFVGVAAFAGIGGVTSFRTGRSGYNCFIAVFVRSGSFAAFNSVEYAIKTCIRNFARPHRVVGLVVSRTEPVVFAVNHSDESHFFCVESINSGSSSLISTVYVRTANNHVDVGLNVANVGVEVITARRFFNVGADSCACVGGGSHVIAVHTALEVVDLVVDVSLRHTEDIRLTSNDSGSFNFGLIVGVNLAAFALAFNENVFVRNYRGVVGVNFAAFTLTFNENVFVRSGRFTAFSRRIEYAEETCIRYCARTHRGVGLVVSRTEPVVSIVYNSDKGFVGFINGINGGSRRIIFTVYVRTANNHVDVGFNVILIGVEVVTASRFFNISNDSFACVGGGFHIVTVHTASKVVNLIVAVFLGHTENVSFASNRNGSNQFAAEVRSYNVFFCTACTLAVNVGVTSSRNFVSRVAVTTFAGVGGVTFFRTGRSSYNAFAIAVFVGFAAFAICTNYFNCSNTSLTVCSRTRVTNTERNIFCVYSYNCIRLNNFVVKGKNPRLVGDVRNFYRNDVFTFSGCNNKGRLFCLINSPALIGNIVFTSVLSVLLVGLCCGIAYRKVTIGYACIKGTVRPTICRCIGFDVEHVTRNFAFVATFVAAFFTAFGNQRAVHKFISTLVVLHRSSSYGDVVANCVFNLQSVAVNGHVFIAVYNDGGVVVAVQFGDFTRQGKFARQGFAVLQCIKLVEDHCRTFGFSFDGDGELFRFGNVAAGKGSRNNSRRICRRSSRRKYVVCNRYAVATLYRPVDGYVRVNNTSGRKRFAVCADERSTDAKSFQFSCNLNFRRKAILANHGSQTTDVIACAACIGGHRQADGIFAAVVTHVVVSSFTVLIFVKMCQNGLKFFRPEEAGYRFGGSNDVVVRTVIAKSYTDVLLNTFVGEGQVEIVGAFDIFSVNVYTFFIIFGRAEIVSSCFIITVEIEVFCQSGLINIKFISGVFNRFCGDHRRNEAQRFQCNCFKFNLYSVAAFGIGDGCGQNVRGIFFQFTDDDGVFGFTFLNGNAINASRPSDVILSGFTEEGIAVDKRKVFTRFQRHFIYDTLKVIFNVFQILFVCVEHGCIFTTAVRFFRRGVFAANDVFQETGQLDVRQVDFVLDCIATSRHTKAQQH